MRTKSKVRSVLIVAVVMVLVAVAIALSGCPHKPSGGREASFSEPNPTPASEPPVIDIEEGEPQPGTNPEQSAAAPPADDSKPAESEGKVIEVTGSTFAREVFQTDKPVVVEFWATYCGPCYVVRPRLEALAQEYAGQVKFVAVDIQSNSVLTNQFSVTYIPLLVIIENGEETQRFPGSLPEDQLRQKVAAVAATGS